jgi:hypothetical protein
MIARPTDFTNFPQYSALLTIWHNQQNQDTENTAAHDNFVTASATWLVATESQIAYNKPTQPAPTPPLMRIYNDDGSVTTKPFTDLTTPVLPTVTAPSSGSIVSTPVMDRTDAILMIVNEIAKKVGV